MHGILEFVNGFFKLVELVAGLVALLLFLSSRDDDPLGFTVPCVFVAIAAFEIFFVTPNPFKSAWGVLGVLTCIAFSVFLVLREKSRRRTANNSVN